MKIALCSTYVPFHNSGARHIVEWLQTMLERQGHHVERVYLPEDDNPDLLLQQMAAFRWLDLSAADRVICFRPQSHLISHPHKIVWFIHHVRVYYDLYASPYRGFPDDARHRGVRAALIEADTAALREARRVFTNSQVVADRLAHYNQVDSEVLYPPLIDAERFHCRGHNDEVVYVCRLEHHKRQHLLIEALALTTTSVRLRLCGTGSGPDYPATLAALIARLKLKRRVTLENRWISEDEKVAVLADCLATAYLPLDEDSYGYPSLESSHAGKAILTTTDSGGVRELVSDGINGLVVEPTPAALAAALDRMYRDRTETVAMGVRARKRIDELLISWDHVIERLLA
jgi:glycosyltransferase involved in cell wall biosynthesis